MGPSLTSECSDRLVNLLMGVLAFAASPEPHPDALRPGIFPEAPRVVADDTKVLRRSLAQIGLRLSILRYRQAVAALDC